MNRFDRLDFVMNEINLSVSFNLSHYGIAHNAFIKRGDFGVDRKPVFGSCIYVRQVTCSKQRKIESPRDWSCRHRQGVDRNPHIF